MRIDSAGRVGIGVGVTTPGVPFRVSGSRAGDGATSITANYVDVQFNDASVTVGTGFLTYINPQAGTALSTLRHFSALQRPFTGTATNQYGFFADSTLTGATNNYGLYSNIASGTGRWNFYAAGSAANYFAGSFAIGSSLTTEKLNVYADTRVAIRLTNTTGTPAGINDAFIEKDSSNNLQIKSSGGATNSNILFLTGISDERLRITSTGVSQFKAATQETKVAVAASDIDLSLGNYFTKTISGTTTFTVSNTAASGLVSAFVLELTNGGSATVNWFSGVDWPAGTPPTLTAAGKDILAFFTHDGGTTWNGFVLGLDVK
jgi:hypothetical protein